MLNESLCVCVYIYIYVYVSTTAVERKDNIFIIIIVAVIYLREGSTIDYCVCGNDRRVGRGMRESKNICRNLTSAVALLYYYLPFVME